MISLLRSFSVISRLAACIALSFGALQSLAPSAFAQKGPYEITSVSPNLVKTPDYQFSGDSKAFKAREWLEVEVEFKSEVEMTEELTVKAYILLNDGSKPVMFVGEVTHVNISKGRDRRSVLYIAPNTLERLTGGKAFTASGITNVGVELLKQGQVVAIKSAKDSKGPWWQQNPQTTGFVLNKNETPFAPLYWDRYEAIKSTR